MIKGTRYYDPGTGKFLSEDPIRYRGGDSNFYRYVSSSPIIKDDPTGNNPAIGAGIGTIILPGAGTVIGAVVGGVAAYLVGDYLADAYSKNSNPTDGGGDSTKLGDPSGQRPKGPGDWAIETLIGFGLGKLANSCGQEE